MGYSFDVNSFIINKSSLKSRSKTVKNVTNLSLSQPGRHKKGRPDNFGACPYFIQQSAIHSEKREATLFKI